MWRVSIEPQPLLSCSTSDLLRLLLNVRLRTPLQRLALIMPLLRLPRRVTIARHARDRPADRPGDPIAHPLAQIVQLALRLLRLALLVLLRAGLLEILVADEPAERLLARADGLVPAAGLPVLVVGRDARGGDRDAADGAAGVREGVFGFGLALLLVGLLLVGRVAGDGAEGGGGGAGGLGGSGVLVVGEGGRGVEWTYLVHVGLQGGGVLVRHGCWGCSVFLLLDG